MKTELLNYYKPLVRAIELLVKGDFTACYILSNAGYGKTTIVDDTLNRLKANHVIFKGDISEPKFYEFVQLNNDKILVFRDINKLLKRISFIDTLKAITDPTNKRIVARKTYAEHGIQDEFEFTGKIILELNSIGKKYKEDTDALFTRGIFIELIFSFEDLANIMKLIAQTEEEKIVTEFLTSKVKLIGSGFNLRTQNLAFKVYEASKLDKLDWKEQINLFLDKQISDGRKLLYRLAGFNPAKRIDFVKFLIKEAKYSYSTSERRINEWLYLGEIYSEGLKKQSHLCLNPFK